MKPSCFKLSQAYIVRKYFTSDDVIDKLHPDRKHDRPHPKNICLGCESNLLYIRWGLLTARPPGQFK